MSGIPTTDIPWTDGTWTTEPEAVRIHAGGMDVTAREGSDAWRTTSYGFVHDTEHALLAPLAPGTAVEVAFALELSEQFDQAGVFVRVDDETWIKAGVERSDGEDGLGAVVTRGVSDWSLAPVPGCAPAWTRSRGGSCGSRRWIRTRPPPRAPSAARRHEPASRPASRRGGRGRRTGRCTRSAARTPPSDRLSVSHSHSRLVSRAHITHSARGHVRTSEGAISLAPSTAPG
jgi:hypothetical protein